MQVAGFVEELAAYCDRQFPHTCPTCGARFASFEGYVRGTTPIGLLCFDTARALADALGTLSLANCSCGSTISLRCAETGNETYKMFIEAIQSDASRLAISPQQVLERLRDAVREVALGSSISGQELSATR